MSGARSKNFRRRSEDTDANADDVSPSPKPQPASQKPKTKPEPVQTRTRLSFADDEEEDDDAGFRPSRPQRPVKPNPVPSNSSHKLTAAKDRIKAKGLAYSSTPLPSNLQSQAGEYTKEKLLELQKNARPLGSISRPPPKSNHLSSLETNFPPKPDKPPEPVIVLKGLVKPMTPSTAANEGEEEEDDDEEEELEKGVPSIPDQATIDKIKAKRQQVQQPRHAAPDFISLDDGGAISSRMPAGTGGSSDEDEDAELKGRIALLGDKPGQSVNKGIFEGIKDSGIPMNNAKFKDLQLHEEDEDEDEERRWEEEQFRKALGRRLDDSAAPAAGGIIPNGMPLNAYAPQVQPQQNVMFRNQIAEGMSLAQQAKVAVEAVHGMMSKLKESHKSTLDSLVRVDTSLSEALIEISNLEKSLEADDEKYVYFQQLREYISVLSDFLSEKALLVEVLEEEMQKLHKDRAQSIFERRAADLADGLAALEPAIKAAMRVLDDTRSLGSSNQMAAAISAAQAAATTAMEASRNLPVKLDEFGRDENRQKRVTLQLRAESRKRRMARQESKRMKLSGNSSIIEGELSTDESDNESAAYVSSRDEHYQTADKIFSDASNEYANLKDVKERFESWKQQYPLVYRNAYVSDSVQTVFAPFVRLELVKWDPLYRFTDFVGMEWHKELFDYGLLESKVEDAEEDADMNLIPDLVEKVALPIFHHEVTHCWDVLSTKQTQNAVSSAKMLISYLSPSTKALHELLSVVNSRLTEAVKSLNVPVWGPNVVRAVPGAGQFSAYCFGMSVRLLRNICLWKDILAGPALEKLAIAELLRAKILPHIRSSGLDVHDSLLRLERVVDSLSGFVSGAGVRGDHSEKLRPLTELVKDLGATLERTHKSRVDENEVHGLARRLKKIMVSLNDYDGARAILKMFQVKEAL